jgi:hypothetical protein
MAVAVGSSKFRHLGTGGNDQEPGGNRKNKTTNLGVGSSNLSGRASSIKRLPNLPFEKTKLKRFSPNEKRGALPRAASHNRALGVAR